MDNRNWRKKVTKKYKQQVPEGKVKKMIKHGFRAKQYTWETYAKKMHGQGDIVPTRPEFDTGYCLVDSEGFILSPNLRQYIAMAWDDILLVEGTTT